MISNKLETSLSVAGVTTTSPCSQTKLRGQLSDIVGKFQDDVKKTVDDLSYKTFGNFFVVTSALLAEALGGAAVAIIDQFVGKALLENALSAMSGAISTTMSVIPGAAVIIRYNAAKNLRADVIKRYNLAEILLREIRIILHWVDILSKSPMEYNRTYYNNLRKAYTYVGRARRAVNIEISKNLNKKTGISGNNINGAITNIDLGISFLTPGFEKTSDILKKLHSEYKLKTSIPSAKTLGAAIYTEYGSWIKYVSDVSTELKQRYGNDEKAMADIIYRIVPALPDFLRKFAVNYVIGKSSSILVDRFPIWIIQNDVIDRYITKKFTNSSVNDLIPINKDSKEYAMFSNADTKDITWQRITEAIAQDKFIIKNVPIYYDVIEKHSSIIQTMLKPADGYLTDVHNEMRDIVETGKADSSTSQLLTNKKFGSWVVKLEAAKTVLRTATSNMGLMIKTSTGLYNLNTNDVLNSMHDIELTLSSLETILDEKDYGDDILLIANNYLLSLVAQSSTFILNMVNPGSARNVLAGLRSLETLLVSSRIYDKRLLISVENFMSSAEKLPWFDIVQHQIDALLSSMEAGNSLIAKELVKQVRHGDISGIASYLDIASFASSSTSCAVKSYIENGGKDDDTAARIAKALSAAGVDAASQTGIASAIVSLKKKYSIIKEFINTSEPQ